MDKLESCNGRLRLLADCPYFQTLYPRPPLATICKHHNHGDNTHPPFQ